MAQGSEFNFHRRMHAIVLSVRGKGQVTAEARVLGEVHLTHAASTEQFEDLVGAEGFADQYSPKRG